MLSPADELQVVSWLTCDGVHIDPHTHKHTILGVFTHLNAGRLPLQVPYMIWFLALEGVPAGKHTLRITAANPGGGAVREVVLREFECPQPRSRVNLINELQGFVFERAGEHPIEIEINGRRLLRTSLAVAAARPGPAAPPPPFAPG